MDSRRSLCLFVLFSAILGLLLIGSSLTVQAASFTLAVDRVDDNPAADTCTEEPDDCSLRGALGRAAADPANSYLIALAAGATYEVTITDEGATGLPPIAGDVVIDGRGATITRGGELILRFFFVPTGGALTLNRVTLSAGNAGSCPTCDGGAVFVDYGGSATIHESYFFDNVAGAGGGALYVKRRRYRVGEHV
jgi:hypothetical protein